MNTLVKPLAVFLSLLLGGCAGTPPVEQAALAPEVEAEMQRQTEAAMRSYFADLARLEHLHYRLAKAALPLCPEQSMQWSGFELASLVAFDAEDWPALKAVLRLSDDWSIRNVIRESPAERAGLRIGDILVKIDGVRVGGDPAGTDRLYEKLDALERRAGSYSIEISRQGERLTLSIAQERACGIYPDVVTDSSVNGFIADGYAYVTSGAMRFANDDELAVLVSHEIAHGLRHAENNIATSPQSMREALANGMRSLVSLFSAERLAQYSQRQENEADYLGLYVLALADMPYQRAPEFWRRIAVQAPATIDPDRMSSHPGSSERFVALARAVKEIEAKQASGKPLRPERNTP